MSRFVWISIAVFSCAVVSHAQEKGCLERTLLLSARDRHSPTAVYDLQADKLRGKIDGRAINIATVTRASASRRVVIVLDASGSMTGLKWQTELNIASEVIRSSPQATRFVFILFGDRVFKTTDFEPQSEALEEIRTLTVIPRGRTALHDATLGALVLLTPTQEGDSVVVESDGTDNHSKTSFAQLQKMFLSQGVRLFFAKFFDHDFANDDRVFGGEFGLLAEATGGKLEDAVDPKSFASIGQDFAFEISNYNVLHLVLEEPLKKATSLHLELVDSAGQKQKDVDLVFPQKMFPCIGSSVDQ